MNDHFCQLKIKMIKNDKMLLKIKNKLKKKINNK